jgi:hypothetical protein
VDSTQYTFIYNRTFSEKSPESDAAWDNLFPEQAGYFTHPTIAPHRSTFSVFHLLHCLVCWFHDVYPAPPFLDHTTLSMKKLTRSHSHQNGIRQGYWAVHDLAVAGGTPLKDDDLPMMISPPHIRHCIDLLRQSLMCNADLTVEVKDDKAGGVHGFGTEHQCVDWDSLVSWTTEWETRKPHP